jgi:transcriptional regulator with XRE-family HTH domain
VNAKAFGQAVHRKRMALKLTQEQFSEAIEVSRTYLQNIEAGKANPTIEVVERIKNVCKCPWDHLLG